MQLNIRTLTLAAAGAIIWSTGGHAAGDPSGVWLDQDGRGAVEIAPCAGGQGYCGYVVHITDARNAKRCGLQILGNVTSNGGGWIYSPDRGRKYSVALTRLGDDKLRVVGNAGSFFSKTFTWRRAPDDIARCGETTAAAPAKTSPTATSAAPAREAATAPDDPISTGATSPSLALMGVPRKRAAAAAPVATPPAAKETAPVAQEAAPVQTAAAPAPAEESFEATPERKCKFKIPYVGRVITVPCRD